MTTESKPTPAPFEIPVAVTVASIVLAAIGVVHGWVYYSALGLNIFDYIGAADFVVFALKNWGLITFVLIVISIASYWTWRWRIIHLALVFFLAVGTSAFVAYRDSGFVRAGDTVLEGRPPCRVTIEQDGHPETVANITVLGTAGGFLFYYQKGSSHLVRSDKILDLGCAGQA